MEKLKENRKKAILCGIGILALILVLIFTLWFLLGHGGQGKNAYRFSLSERDIAVNVGQTVQLKVIPEKGSKKNADIKMTWVSEKDAVAAVSKDGVVTAAAGGESRITAIAKYKGEEYSVSCMVTVKSPDKDYSDYKILWNIQNQNRRGYDVVEEKFERLVGSKVELTEQEAMQHVPKNYVLNTKKGVWKGVVKEGSGQCVLEVYIDVAEVNYYIDSYYESDTKLGTYSTKETKVCKAYAFSGVEIPKNAKEGFKLSDKTNVKDKKIETGSHIKLYYDRIRSKVTVRYETRRDSAVYTNVYGVGLIDAPANALVDSLERYNTSSGCYIGGKRSASIQDDLKKITKDTTVQVKLENFAGWVDEPDGTLQCLMERRNMNAYAYLKGSGNTVYLSATYDLTGSQSNMVGIVLRSGGSVRHIRFADHGIYVWNSSGNPGIVDGGDLWKFNNGGKWDNNSYVWIQNKSGGNGTKVSAKVLEVIKNTERSSHDLVWVIYEGVLYCNLDGVAILSLPLTWFDKNWTAEKKYEIGFSAFDGNHSYDDLKIRNISVCFDKEAESKLKLNSQADQVKLNGMGYDVITGTYLPGSVAGFSTLNGKEVVGNTGISADIKLQNMENSASAYGVTVSVGDKSVQYVMQGSGQSRRHNNYGWGNMAYLKVQDGVIPFGSDGSSHMEAFVKDGYFYILYNGVLAQSVNMLSMFPEYNPKTTKVSVGLCANDANLGLAEIQNVKLLSKKVVSAKEVQPWGYYSEAISGNGKYSFADGYLQKIDSNWTAMPFYGNSKIWQVEGKMKRTDAQNAARLRMGFNVGGKRAVAESEKSDWTADGIAKVTKEADEYQIDITNKVNNADPRGAYLNKRVDITQPVINMKIDIQNHDNMLMLVFSNKVPTFKEGQGALFNLSEEAGKENITIQLSHPKLSDGGYDMKHAQVNMFNTWGGTVSITTIEYDWTTAHDFGVKKVGENWCLQIDDQMVSFPADRQSSANNIFESMTANGAYIAVATVSGRVTCSNVKLVGKIVDENAAVPQETKDENLWITGEMFGFSPAYNGSWSEEWVYHTGLNRYVCDTGASRFFGEPRETDEIAFKAVIYEDVLYVWFDGTLSWKISLTDNTLTSSRNGFNFEKDGDYQLSLLIGNGAGQGEITDVKVMMGYQVTEQEGFAELIQNAKNERKDEKLAKLLSGKLVSILGDSISTYPGYSNSDVNNTTLINNKFTYNGANGNVFDWRDTYWGRLIEKYDMKLLVNNSCSGNELLKDSGSGVTAKAGYIRAEELAANTGELKGTKPDIILLHMGTNDYRQNEPVGELTEATYASVRTKDGYITPKTFTEAYIITIEKMRKLYPDADICCFTLLPSSNSNNNLRETYNERIREIAAHYDNTILVDDAEVINTTNYAALAFDEIHPNYVGVSMIADKLEQSFKEGYGLTGISVEKLENRWIFRPLGKSKAWQVEGTMERTDAMASEMLRMGFRIRVGNKSLQILGSHTGFFPRINGNWDWNLYANYAEGSKNPYVLDQTAACIFKEPRTADKLTFKAMIEKDILYVWFDGKLCWQIPLTNNKFNGNFAAGSDYQLDLVIGDGKGLGKITDLKVKTGKYIDSIEVTD